MATTTIIDLPEELIETVLQLVKDNMARDDFWNLLQVCHKLHRIGLGLCNGLGFAAPAVIESDTRRKDVQAQGIDSDIYLAVDFSPALPSLGYFALLKSLTIHVQHRRTAAKSSPSVATDLVGSLQGIFKSTPELTTFSFRFSDGWDFPTLDVPAVPQSLLARLVAALPPTVVNLELDTAGTDVTPSTEVLDRNEDAHLCCQLRKIVRRLEYLRLKVGHVCKSLLDFQSNAPSCGENESCGFCTTNQKATCELLSSWKMRAMIVWLPWGQGAENNSFVQASTALLDSSLRKSTIILFVHQNKNTTDKAASDSDITSSRTFSWDPQTNLSPKTEKQEVYPVFTPIFGSSRVVAGSLIKHLTHRTPENAPSCAEHDLILSYANRTFALKPASNCQYVYVAEQMLQSTLSWSQNSHLGYRYPILLADEPRKTFWKGSGLWACRFPGCKTRSQSVSHLRRHIAYTHPGNPHSGLWNHNEPCPSVGCDRVGNFGFKGRGHEWEQHLLEHHLGLCPLVNRVAPLDLRMPLHD